MKDASSNDSSEMQTSQVPKEVYGSLEASGFPFQTAVEDVIRNTVNWTVLAVEFPWRDRDGKDQFLDIVAGSGQFVVAVECKKTQKETLTFLLPHGSCATKTDRSRLLFADWVRDSLRQWTLFCSEWLVGPASFESSFCVVSTSNSGKDQRMLEKDVGRLILGTDAYAQRMLLGIPAATKEEPGKPFVPVLVTNAPLFVARYDPADISLETGGFRTVPKDVTSVPWVGFRKSFPSSGRIGIGERTAFLVAAVYLSNFLVKLSETIPTQPVAGARRTHLPMENWR